ncbi:MAG: FlgD immunoglobulin-like domain containing protein [Candidatus Cloacimonadales bacterium]|nr:FlgD immunoglobulin-like domain containing protein [Candidatus Cloacimonadales bacterium]
MKLKFFLLFVFVSVFSLLTSITWHIKQDGTGDFTTIQEGINASVDTDTVLVYPGTYYENIIYNGKNITVASLELTTGDPSYIPLTVINGQQQGSCVRVWDQESTAKIQGFTLTNGWGSQWYRRSGGGVIITGEYQNPTSFSIKNCRITNNYSETGGGIYAFRSNLELSGVSIHNNYSYMCGGGIDLNETIVDFNNVNRCNIYDNLAGTGLDIYSFRCQTNEVIVDTFTVIEPTRYFANQFELNSCPNPPYSFDILHASMQPVNDDLFVSPYGDDANSGLSSNEPMKTIIQAIRKVASDSLNPKTVHLAAGVYSKSANDQFFAFGGKDNINIIGDGKTTTIIDGEYGQYPLFYMGGADNAIIENMTFKNINYYSSIIRLFDSDFCLFKNLIIQNFEGTDIIGAFISNPTEHLFIDNVDFINCFTPLGVAAADIGEIDYLEMDGCKFINNTCSGSAYTQLCAGLQTGTYNEGEVVIKNTRFSNNVIDASEYGVSALVLNTLNGESGKYTISNCLFDNNQCLGTAYRTVNIDGSDDVYINNSTFVNNTSTYTLIILRNPIEFHNNIMRNNCNYEIFLPDNSSIGYQAELNISHCNIQGGYSAIYNQNNANIVNWGEGNIDADPQFLLSGDDPYQLTELSPCIDTGTPDTTGLFIPPWDVLYNQRVWDGDNNGTAIIDMGCYEYGAELYVEATQNQIPSTPYQLTNYPNPFNPETKIVFNLPESGKVKLEIYNIKGQKVKTLMDAYTAKGEFTAIWNGRDNSGKRVASGEYLATLKVNDEIVTERKLVLLK